MNHARSEVHHFPGRCLAFARSDEKLSVAKENGAHHTVDTRDKTVEDVQNELRRLTGRRDVDAVLDCA